MRIVGDIQVNASTVTYNEDNGVNITYDGGWRVFNLSTFSHNYGNGVNVTLNETSIDNKTRRAMQQQRTEVTVSGRTRDVIRLVWPFDGIVQKHIHN